MAMVFFLKCKNNLSKAINYVKKQKEHHQNSTIVKVLESSQP